ncbi:DUF5980 family protein [Micromonospora sp. HUAS LYJ1]|uniref:DUF5980 family protein n=1 Tax=Micromonospora sp. HUAS LYJ1 TaxID=3061626 RepID=UPI002671608A|nr:DUF5980 family protein [Micromonospora sp. HUAS LYJ1]WKU08320.1 DUF5980 family protein [Micromonospora sp. HUAS LYJ1]
MTFSRTARRITPGALAAMLLALVGGTPVAAAPATTATGTTSAWTLVDLSQRICATSDDPRTLYYFVVLDGTWSSTITASYTGMPAGTEVYSPQSTPPGSGDGNVVQILTAFRLHSAPLGHHVPQLRATDGTVTQSVPVTLDIQSSC